MNTLPLTLSVLILIGRVIGLPPTHPSCGMRTMKSPRNTESPRHATIGCSKEAHCSVQWFWRLHQHRPSLVRAAALLSAQSTLLQMPPRSPPFVAAPSPPRPLSRCGGRRRRRVVVDDRRPRHIAYGRWISGRPWYELEHAVPSVPSRVGWRGGHQLPKT